MKKLLLFLLLLETTGFSFSQSNNPPQVNLDYRGDVVFPPPETNPEFPGGKTALFKFIAANITYPDSAKSAMIKGKVYVGFTVTTTGEITDIEIRRGIGGGCDEEVIRVIKLMPAWTPGTMNRQVIDCRVVIPVTFK